MKYQDRIEGGIHILSLGTIRHYERFIPFIRPMSSMTDEEKNQWFDIINHYNKEGNPILTSIESIDWLNANHFDYRELIEKGLALEAPKDMYNTKTE